LPENFNSSRHSELQFELAKGVSGGYEGTQHGFWRCYKPPFDVQHRDPATGHISHKLLFAGEPWVLKKAVCMHEEDNGTLWKHTEYRTGHAEVNKSNALFLFALSMLLYPDFPTNFTEHNGTLWKHIEYCAGHAEVCPALSPLSVQFRRQSDLHDAQAKSNIHELPLQICRRLS